MKSPSYAHIRVAAEARRPALVPSAVMGMLIFVFMEAMLFAGLISAFTIIVPPLRDRPSEILLLARHFLKDVSADLGHPAPELSAAAESVLRRSAPVNAPRS